MSKNTTWTPPAPFKAVTTVADLRRELALPGPAFASVGLYGDGDAIHVKVNKSDMLLQLADAPDDLAVQAFRRYDGLWIG